ncbi:MAG: type II toxin-antitoxin system VapC family toxin [Anaerolineae bacterium]|jgi:predicted nucleic acid-binding protein
MDIAFDTSVLIGLLDPQDLWHPQAVALYDALRSAGFTGVYFDCAIAETISTATRRLREKKRADEIAPLLGRLNASFPPESLTWILPDVSTLYPEILSLVRTSKGELNFNDALIALACRERGIPSIASFDRDFDQVSWLRRLAEAGKVA